MKVSYSNYPILQKLLSDNLGGLPAYPEDINELNGIVEDFKKQWKKNRLLFNQEIVYVSKPFLSAMELSIKQMVDLYYNSVLESFDGYVFGATFIIQNDVYMMSHVYNGSLKDIRLCLFMFRKDGMPLGFLFNDGENEVRWASKLFEIKTKDKLTEFLNARAGMGISINLFREYAEVETKSIKGNSKVKDFNCKYINDTKLPITYLDSKWFTNLVKSDGFKVRGHFRLQPKKKDGEWTKELIWINDFEKSGYTAKARMLNN